VRNAQSAKIEEDDLRKTILLGVGALVLLAAGCEGNKAPTVPATPKWKGEPYRLAFDTKQAKPNPAGITIPAVKWTANPEMLEKRAALVIRFDVTGGKKDDAVMNQMVMAPTDIPGEEGALTAEYLDVTDKELAAYLGAYCLKGKVKLSVAFARSSLNPRPTESELENKRLSDWLPIEVDFKNPHPKC
jgi:hypothetical protein